MVDVPVVFLEAPVIGKPVKIRYNRRDDYTDPIVAIESVSGSARVLRITTATGVSCVGEVTTHTKQRTRKHTAIIGMILALLVIIALSNQIHTRKNVKVVIDLTKVMNQSPAVVDSLLGQPVEVTPITTPSYRPGEFRMYQVTGLAEPLQVRFRNGVAVNALAYFSQPRDKPEDLMMMAGIDVSETSPRVEAPAAVRWSGTFGGVYLKDAAANRSWFESNSPFNAVGASTE